MRKLLPYEHELIAALGITKEEYLEFVALQQEYKDIKEGTTFDIRNDLGVTAIVLTVVGIVFQVAASLLAPRPAVPAFRPATGGQNQTREQRFSPRFGFNTTQELAKYGDVVPLVYTNTATNSNGGVRLAGSLVWSAVRSYGSSQFLQMLMVLAGNGVTIDKDKSAFGQTAITDLIGQNKWLYHSNRGGAPRYYFETYSQWPSDPSYTGQSWSYVYELQPNNASTTRVEGFSQAYSPSTSNTFGGYSPVPIQILTFARDSNGNKSSANLQITIEDSPSSGTAGATRIVSPTANRAIAVGNTICVKFQGVSSTPPSNTTIQGELERIAQDARRTLSGDFDQGGVFKFGSAKFKVIELKGATTIDDGDVYVYLQCIEAGTAPTTPYTTTAPLENKTALLKSQDYLDAKATYLALLAKDMREPGGPTVTIAGEPTETALYSQYGNYLIANKGIPLAQAIPIKNAQDLLDSGNIWTYALTYTKQTKVVPITNYGKGGTYITYQNQTVNVVSGATWASTPLTADQKAQLYTYIDFESRINDSLPDRTYRTKALVRIEEASYSTISPCNIVDIALRCKVFNRVSGRQRFYGLKNVASGYGASDNGITLRTSLFLVRYKAVGDPGWKYVRGIFAVRRAADQDNFIYLKFNGGSTAKQWQFQLEPVIDPNSEVKKLEGMLTGANGRVTYYYIENSGPTSSASAINNTDGTVFYYSGFAKEATNSDNFPPINKAPKDMTEWDWFGYDADTQLTQSFEAGPELAITSVSEQQLGSTSRLYSNLQTLGFNVYSGRNLQDMRSFSTFVTQGKFVELLNPTFTANDFAGGGPSNYAPDIFYDTVIDQLDGIGKYAVAQGIDVATLRVAKRFCVTNKLFMDCVIADAQSWREFWATVAPYSLLEFARVNGRETLQPAVPYDSNGAITRNVTVSALFNQGNILEDSYKEEFIDYGANVQDLIATVVYRALDSKGIFPVNKSVNISRVDTSETNAIRQTFDLSAYVTTEAQAVLYGKLLCNIRRHVRSAIEFKTYPTSAPVNPGSYIYVDIGQNSWNNIYTGVVDSSGYLNVPVGSNIPPGNYAIMLYRHSDKRVIQLPTTYVYNNYSIQASAYPGYLFVLGTVVRTKRCFRVTEIEMDEEGEVTVRATGFPLDNNGLAEVSNFSDGLFSIQG